LRFGFSEPIPRLVTLLFIGILVTTYVEAKKANPVILDESGGPVNAQSAHGQK
jgi:hypothetical protein